VPDFLPFAGVRYEPRVAGADLDVLVAPPYDVIDEEHRAALEAAHERNAVRLVLPRDVATDGDRYEAAARRYAEWRAAGVLAADPAPRFYTYRMDYRDSHGAARHTLGVLGALALPQPGESGVLPHERTLAKAKSDRLALLRAMRVNVDPIWGLSLTAGLTARLHDTTPLVSCTDHDGVTHSLGALDAPADVDAVRREVSAAPVVLADGHHRFETACTYRDERPPSDTGAGAILCLVVELADDELCIEPIHRLVDLPEGPALRERLADAFDVVDLGANTPEGVDALEHAMDERGGIGLVDPQGLALAIARPAVVGGALAGEPPTIAHLDATLVEAIVVPRLPDATWEYRHDARATAAIVAKDPSRAALLLRPVSTADTRAAALAGVRMPQKTTFFWPKPRSGMVLRDLDA
jgi:uncharacterized protein (DUF1015 family)